MSTIDFPETGDEVNDAHQSLFRIQSGVDSRDGTPGSDTL